MKVLFVGEGPHDIGRGEDAANPPSVANGVVPILARKVVSSIAGDSVAIKWREISLFSPAKKGLENKVAAAILVSAHRFACAGTICVRDNDKKDGLAKSLEDGIAKGLKQVGVPHVAVWGLAVQSIEAWALGAPSALATVLGVPRNEVEKRYPLRDVEKYHEKTGNAEHRPKKILEDVAALGNQHAGTEFRERVAESTYIAELEKNCPEGFEPFARRLRSAFGA